MNKSSLPTVLTSWSGSRPCLRLCLTRRMLGTTPPSRRSSSRRGPNADSIRGTVDVPVALGDPNNGNGPAAETGRREINWDGGGANDTTSPPVTPFDVFLNTRGARFTTPGTGLGRLRRRGLQGGLATLLPTPPTERSSPLQPVAALHAGGAMSRTACSSCPAPTVTAATVRGFGAVFTDVDRPTTEAARPSCAVTAGPARGSTSSASPTTEKSTASGSSSAVWCGFAG